MNYFSTRQHGPIGFDEAIQCGLAPDGGLYVPENFPQLNVMSFEKMDYATLAEHILVPFMQGSAIDKALPHICKQAFNFEVPLTSLNENTYLLELFHGPTLAFKDFGARFLAECMNRLATKKTTLMIATSGDTGSAVASAFHGKENIQVVILFPKNKISKRQEHQITCWGDNILALEVEGTFDDCQKLVKSAFHDDDWKQYTHLSTANSINIGRLLPQMSYYAFSSLQYYARHQMGARFIVPSGNLGNVTAAFWTQKIGFPISEIVVATNANTVVPDYIRTGQFHAQKSVSTLANAMDVGNPSNFERLAYLFQNHENFAENMPAFSVNDHAIIQTIQDIYRQYNTIVCPHTATACYVRNHLSDKPWIVVATAHPSKFETVIEPMLGVTLEVPEALNKLLQKPKHVISVKADQKNILNEVKKHSFF